jgi:hypothetical protein
LQKIKQVFFEIYGLFAFFLIPIILKFFPELFYVRAIILPDNAQARIVALVIFFCPLLKLEGYRVSSIRELDEILMDVVTTGDHELTALGADHALLLSLGLCLCLLEISGAGGVLGGFLVVCNFGLGYVYADGIDSGGRGFDDLGAPAAAARFVGFGFVVF